MLEGFAKTLKDILPDAADGFVDIGWLPREYNASLPYPELRACRLRIVDGQRKWIEG